MDENLSGWFRDGRRVHSVMFRMDGYIEISFSNEEESYADAELLRTVVFTEEPFAKELEGLRSELYDLVDEVAVFLRNEDARRKRLNRPELSEHVEED